MRKYRWALHATTFFVLSVYLSYLGTTIFACIPVEQYFYWPPNGFCLDEGLVDTVLSSLNTLSEAVVAALPIPMIMRLGMNNKQMAQVTALLCMGFLVSIVGAVRTYYVWILFEADDLTWWSGPHWICSEVEICVAMVILASFIVVVMYSCARELSYCVMRPSIAVSSLLTSSPVVPCYSTCRCRNPMSPSLPVDPGGK